MLSKFGNFTRAVVREIDPTLAVQALRSDTSVSIDISRAILQHKQYINILRNQLGLKVDVLPSNGFPDSVFIEDTSVVVGHQVLITNPGAESRAREVATVRDYFQQQAGMRVSDLRHGTLDGGDVLFTGHSILVGRSQRTDLKGILSLQLAFPTYPVYYVEIERLRELAGEAGQREELLHLKSCCSMLSMDTLAVGGTYGRALDKALGHLQASCVHPAQSLTGSIALSANDIKILQTPHSSASSAPTHPLKRLQIVSFVEAAAANVLFVNDHIVCASDLSDESKAVFQRHRQQLSISSSTSLRVVEADNGELSKCDGALTCCSVLF